MRKKYLTSTKKLRSGVSSAEIRNAFTLAKSASNSRLQYLKERDFVRARLVGDLLIERVFKLAVLIGAKGNEYLLEELVLNCEDFNEFYEKLNEISQRFSWLIRMD